MGVVEKDLRRLIIRKPDVLRQLVETDSQPGLPVQTRLEIRVGVPA